MSQLPMQMQCQRLQMLIDLNAFKCSSTPTPSMPNDPNAFRCSPMRTLSNVKSNPAPSNASQTPRLNAITISSSQINTRRYAEETETRSRTEQSRNGVL